MKMNQRIKKLFAIILTLSVALGQNAELITQKINVENAIRDKVSVTINKLVNRNDYVIIVNARMDLKPSFQMNDATQKESNNQSMYNPIPGLLPTVPKQNIQEPNTNGSFNYSTEKYLLYGLDIAVYLDEDVSSGMLQQNITKLVLDAIPEIIDCDDCIRFETMQMNNNTDSNFQNMIQKIEKLEQEKRDGEQEIIDWKFEKLEEQLMNAEDARQEWESQARERERQRAIADSSELARLQKIEREYRSKQDSLYQLTSFKLDKAIQSRTDADAETKAQLIDIIKKGISNDSGKDQFSDVVTSDVPEDLSMKNAPSGQSDMVLYIVGSVILLLLLTLLFIVLRNQKKPPVYLKPKSVSDNQSASSHAAPVVPHTPTETSANMNSDVKRSELNSLRQSAVSMSVGQKDGATQIVKDWLNTESGSENSDGSEEEN
tara:strand:- start:6172 stop:7467 length:1296 start_codon:yes stop_codon:yes gene_type:complete